jgi:hypothetical protein
MWPGSHDRPNVDMPGIAGAGFADSNEEVNRLSLQPPAPPAPPYVPPSPAGYAPVAQRPPGGGGSRRTLFLAIGGGIALAVVILLVVVAATRKAGVVPRGDEPTTPGPVPSPPLPGADGAIPGEGNDTFLAGGIAIVPRPEGWRSLTRADVQTKPGGHPEAVVLVNDASGVTMSVYVLGPDPNAAGEVNVAAGTHVGDWTRDGADVSIDPTQAGTISGSIVGAASIRYRFALRGRALEGELYHAARQDGYALFLFVDAPQGSLDGSNGTWGPLRDAVIATFAR